MKTTIENKEERISYVQTHILDAVVSTLAVVYEEYNDCEIFGTNLEKIVFDFTNKIIQEMEGE